MKTLICLVSSTFLLGAFAAAQTDAPKKTGTPTKAIVVLVATEGNKVAGTITFTKSADGVHVEGEVTGLAPGKHGFHIHEFGDVTAKDGMSTGGHFNPGGEAHGAPDAEHHHGGDLGNIEADASGTAKINVTDKHLSFEGADSILGRGVVVHAKEDDFKTQPTGNAGGRVAVGVIGAAKGS